MPGSTVVNGRKITHSEIVTDSEDPLAELELLIAAYGLDWQIVGMVQTRPGDTGEVDQDGLPIIGPIYELPVDVSVLGFLVDEFDAAGNPFRPTAPKKLHGMAGQVQFEIQ